MYEIDAGRFPGLYLMITGTPAFFDGPQGVQRSPPLAQRLHVEFARDPRFDNQRAVQIRLQPFDFARLSEEIGRTSCRERVCPYVSISVVAVSLKKQNMRGYKLSCMDNQETNRTLK